MYSEGEGEGGNKSREGLTLGDSDGRDEGGGMIDPTHRVFKRL